MSYLLESYTQAVCDTEGTSMLVQLRPEHGINLRGAPYDLVAKYFVNSLLVLMTRLRRACAFASSGSRCSLICLKWMDSRPNKILDIYLRTCTLCFIYLNINLIRVRRFSELNNSINVVETSINLFKHQIPQNGTF